MVTAIHLDKDDLRIVRREISYGKTIGRAMINALCTHYTLDGQVMNLGAKSASSSYWRVFTVGPNTKITHTDIETSSQDVIKMNVEQPFPLESEQYDAIVCFSLLEHLWSPMTALTEAARVCKTGGKIYGAVPFLLRYHPDPHDYYRYTHEALERMLSESGWRDSQVVAIGTGPCVAAAHQLTISGPIWFRRIMFEIAFWGDSLIRRRKPKADIEFPLGYFFEAQK